MSVKWEKEEGTNNGKLTFEIELQKSRKVWTLHSIALKNL